MQEHKNERKEKFLKDFEAEKRKRNKKIIAITSVITLLGIALFVYINNRPYTSENGGNYNIGEEVSYTGKKVEMKDIKAVVENGKVKIPIKALKENKIIYTEYKSEDPEHVYYGKLKGILPMTAFVSTAGRVVWSTAICEPCYGTRFYLEEKELVCVACGTRWRTTDMQGVGGGCYDYPPEELKYEVEGDYLVIPEAKVKDWKPRYFEDEVMS